MNDRPRNQDPDRHFGRPAWQTPPEDASSQSGSSLGNWLLENWRVVAMGCLGMLLLIAGIAMLS